MLRACIVYFVPRGVKMPDIVKKIDVCFEVIEIKDAWKMEPNLHIGCHKIKIKKKYFLWIDLTYNFIVRKLFSNMYKLNATLNFTKFPNITACSVGISCILCDVTVTRQFTSSTRRF